MLPSMKKLITKFESLPTWSQVSIGAGLWVLITTSVIATAPTADPQSSKPSQPSVEFSTEIETKPIAFGIEKQNDPTVTSGQEIVKREGQNGQQSLEWQIKKVDGKVEQRTLMSDKTTVQPINKLVAVGTYVAPTPPPAQPETVYYANCSAARAAGAAPVYEGEPGYRSALDRDNDGIGCE